MQGRVNRYVEAVLTLRLRGPSGIERDVETIVDTGFNGFLTLPSPLVRELQLRFHSAASAELADGSTVTLSKYEGKVMWESKLRSIIILETGGGILAGMVLLHRHMVTIHAVDGGVVSIVPDEAMGSGTS